MNEGGLGSLGSKFTFAMQNMTKLSAAAFPDRNLGDHSVLPTSSLSLSVAKLQDRNRITQHRKAIQTYSITAFPSRISVQLLMPGQVTVDG